MEDITAILGLIFVGSIILPFIIKSAFKDNAKFYWQLPVVAGVVFAVWLIASAGFVIVQPGTAGVIIRLGQVTDRVLEPGLHFKTPILDSARVYNTQKVIYETMNQASFTSSNAEYKDFPVDTTTQDGQQIQVRYTIRFSVDPTKIKDVVNSLGTELQIVDKVVKAESRVQVRNLIRKYAAEQLYTGDIQDAQMEIEESLIQVFEDNGIILDAFGIRQIEFEEQYLNAIETKQIEKENVQTEKFRAEQEEFRKEAAITKAQGEAEAQRLQRSTLSDELIAKQWIEKWDGKLPQYFLGPDGDQLIQLPSSN